MSQLCLWYCNTLKWFVLTANSPDESIKTLQTSLSIAALYSTGFCQCFFFLESECTLGRRSSDFQHTASFFLLTLWAKRRCIHYPVITLLLVLWSIIHYMHSPHSPVTGRGEWMSTTDRANHISPCTTIINTAQKVRATSSQFKTTPKLPLRT